MKELKVVITIEIDPNHVQRDGEEKAMETFDFELSQALSEARHQMRQQIRHFLKKDG